LFSWDSANYALAIERIDIGAHRPHPPGYLGYVLAARLLNFFIHDANASLVAWNIIATVLSAVVLMGFVHDVAGDRKTRNLAGWAAVAMLGTSPLIWFYGEIAEIYVSELLVTLLIARAAWNATHGRPGSLARCAASLSAAVLFKMSVAAIMAPVVLYAWRHASAHERTRAAWSLAATLVPVLAIFFVLQPDLISLLWTHFVTATAASRVVGGTTTVLKAVNRNLRDTATAGLAGLGIFNVIALGILAIRERRLPACVRWPGFSLWVIPWLFVLIVIHVGKPGYVLPLLPAAYLIVADYYASRRTPVALALIVCQAMAGIAQFVVLSPLSLAATGGTARYADKPFIGRLLSDLSPVAATTRAAIAESDRRVRDLQDVVSSTCVSRDPVIVGGATIDYRRVLYYFPHATAIDLVDGRVLFVGKEKESASLGDAGMEVRTECPVIWLRQDDLDVPAVNSASRAVSDIGVLLPPATVRIAPTGIRLVASGNASSPN